jgi:rhamnosyltransferase
VLYKPTLADIKFWTDVSQLFCLKVYINGDVDIDLEHYFKIDVLERRERNEGLGAGLNYLLNYGRNNNFDYFIYFDQDTRFDFRMMSELIIDLSQRKLPLAIVGPKKVVKNAIKGATTFDWQNLTPSEWIISSGSIHNLKLIPNSLLYKEDYFIDRLDFEFCYQLRELNYSIMQLSGFYIEHEVGFISSILGKKLSEHSHIRHFYIAQNRVLFFVRDCNLRFINRSVALIGKTSYHLLKVCMEKNSLSKIKSIFFGILSAIKIIRQ